MSVLGNTKSDRHRKAHWVESDGPAREFMHLTRGDLPVERRAEVSRGRATPLRRPVPTRTRPYAGNRHGRPQGSPLHQNIPEVACHALAASRPGPNEAIGETGMGDHKGRPYTRTSRRWRATPLRRPVPARTRASGNRHGRPQGSPLHQNIPEVACHALAASRPGPNEAVGKPAWATTRVAPTPEQPGDEARVGATLAVALPNPPRLRFLRTRWRATPLRRPVPARTRPSGNRHGRPQGSPLHQNIPEVACHALAASRSGPNEGVGKPAWATTSVAPTPEHPGGGVPRPCGAPCRPERGHRGNRHGRRQASPLHQNIPEVACHALAAPRVGPNEAVGKPAWATARPAGAIGSPLRGCRVLKNARCRGLSGCSCG